MISLVPEENDSLVFSIDHEVHVIEKSYILINTTYCIRALYNTKVFLRHTCTQLVSCSHMNCTYTGNEFVPGWREALQL